MTVPLTEETRGMMNTARFGMMKQGSVLVNIARGAIVDEGALLRALDEKLYGAVLDVLDSEPLASDSPLWQKTNAIITPHNSFVGDGNSERLFNVIMEHIQNQG